MRQLTLLEGQQVHGAGYASTFRMAGSAVGAIAVFPLAVAGFTAANATGVYPGSIGTFAFIEYLGIMAGEVAGYYAGSLLDAMTKKSIDPFKLPTPLPKK